MKWMIVLAALLPPSTAGAQTTLPGLHRCGCSMATTITPESLTSKEADWKQRFEREMLSGIEGISLQVRITSCTHLGGTHEVHRPWQQHERVSDVVPGITAVYVVLIQKEALVSASPADVRHWAESAVATINDYDVAGEPLQEALGQCPVFF